MKSNNEYWLEHDSMLRTDFNILSGPDVDEIQAYRSKAAMKPYYKKAGVPTCRQAPVTTQEEAEKFIKKVGYPVIVKPEYGVGAAATWRLENEEDLAAFFAEKPEDAYVMEEYVYGWICSYDAIVDSQSNVLFESMSISPPIMDIVNEQTELVFYVPPSVETQLQERGRATVKSFGVKSRFVHMEFFKLTKAKKGLGKVGDFVGLEVNMRPGGGYMPDMMDFAHSTDVYQLVLTSDVCRRIRNSSTAYFSDSVIGSAMSIARKTFWQSMAAASKCASACPTSSPALWVTRCTRPCFQPKRIWMSL